MLKAMTGWPDHGLIVLQANVSTTTAKTDRKFPDIAIQDRGQIIFGLSARCQKTGRSIINNLPSYVWSVSGGFDFYLENIIARLV